MMRLPPLKAIRAFEAVCRLGSISKAAEELGVVNGAVRQQLSTLEGYFGHPLFDRTGKAVRPLQESEGLAEAATLALGIISRASSAMYSAERATIRIGVPSAFAIWWMMPRLPDMQLAMGNVQIDIVPMPAVEPLSLNPDLDGVIMGGEFRPSLGVSAFRFMDDEFGPVVTPQLAASLGAAPSSLAGLTLFTARSAPRLWSDWLVESRSPPFEVGVTKYLEDLVLALGAARAGSGFTIAPRASIEDDLEQGKLLAPFGFVRRAGGYSICYRDADAMAKPFITLKDWLSAAGASD